MIGENINNYLLKKTEFDEERLTQMQKQLGKNINMNSVEHLFQKKRKKKRSLMIIGFAFNILAPDQETKLQ